MAGQGVGGQEGRKLEKVGNWVERKEGKEGVRRGGER